MESDELPDIQSLADDRNIPLDRVGVRGLHWPITVQDKRHGTQQTTATIDLSVNLPHQFRGTHMSRFVEVLNDYRGDSLIDRLSDILRDIRTSLDADRARLDIVFEYFIEKAAPISGLLSPMAYTCRFIASQDGGDDFILAVTVPVTTLCPCSREIAEFGAHNQRCEVTVQVRYKAFVWLEDLIELVESCASGGLYTILKRPDEKFVTEHAYSHPMFVEDVVRELALKLNAHDQIRWYCIEADSQESIHAHNAYARVEIWKPGEKATSSS